MATRERHQDKPTSCFRDMRRHLSANMCATSAVSRRRLPTSEVTDMICVLRYDLCTQIWSVYLDMICVLRYDLSTQIWSVYSDMICVLRYDLSSLLLAELKGDWTVDRNSDQWQFPSRDATVLKHDFDHADTDIIITPWEGSRKPGARLNTS